MIRKCMICKWCMMGTRWRVPCTCTQDDLGDFFPAIIDSKIENEEQWEKFLQLIAQSFRTNGPLVAGDREVSTSKDIGEWIKEMKPTVTWIWLSKIINRVINAAKIKSKKTGTVIKKEKVKDKKKITQGQKVFMQKTKPYRRKFSY